MYDHYEIEVAWPLFLLWIDASGRRQPVFRVRNGLSGVENVTPESAWTGSGRQSAEYSASVPAASATA